MDFEPKILVWIVVLVIYAVRQIRKLSSVKSTQSRNEEDAPSQQTRRVVVQRPVSKPLHTELDAYPTQATQQSVKTISQRDKAATQQKDRRKEFEDYVEAKTAKVIDYDEQVEDELVVAQRTIKEQQAKAKQQKVLNPSLADAHFEPYALEQSKRNTLLEKLRNPAELGDAVILGEILQRKY